MDIAAFEKKCAIELCTGDVEGLCKGQHVNNEYWFNINGSEERYAEVVHSALIYLEYCDLVIRHPDPRHRELVQIKAFVAEMD